MSEPDQIGLLVLIIVGLLVWVWTIIKSDTPVEAVLARLRAEQRKAADNRLKRQVAREMRRWQ